ncbi:MAG: hypothetical protein K2N72_02920 [Oscillospiraceae bacterium]|nr:hypothetical protein [Oscillospiraceae bacterium]
MATKSILKNIVIKDKKTGLSLVNALEHAEEKHAKNVTFSKAVINADDEMIKKMFKGKSK